MPLPEDFAELTAHPDFWGVYLFEGEDAGPFEDDDEDGDGDGVEAVSAAFGAGGGHALVLDVDLGAESVELGLAVPGREEAAELGWDDRAHCHPHVMSWAELDLLARAVALHDPELRHPGPVLALLARFAFLTEGDDPDGVVPYVDAAFGAVRPGGECGVRADTRDWFEARDLRDEPVRWTAGPGGVPAALAEGESSLDTLRTADSDFPFAAWGALLAEAEETVAAAVRQPALADPAVREALDRASAPGGHEAAAPLADALRTAGYEQPVLLRALTEPVGRAETAWAVATLAGLPTGTVAGRWYGRSPLTGARSWDLVLRLATPEPVVGLAETLDEALREARLGRAEIAGGGSDHTSLDVLVRDDLDGGVSLVAESLVRHGLAPVARLHHAAAPHEPVALPSP
ncbi:hypothetical protein [Streptomyces tritici]|uniref:hypothetical protein n=1 Tax=Streptomyces tritici TaxID=2054410 RepID=UPI003AF13CC8